MIARSGLLREVDRKAYSRILSPHNGVTPRERIRGAPVAPIQFDN